MTDNTRSKEYNLALNSIAEAKDLLENFRGYHPLPLIEAEEAIELLERNDIFDKNYIKALYYKAWALLNLIKIGFYENRKDEAINCLYEAENFAISLNENHLLNQIEKMLNNENEKLYD